MLDRRKIIALIIGGVLVLALIIAAIALVVTNQNGDSAPSEPAATSTPSSSPSAGDEAAEAIDTFETDYLEMAREAAVIATSWNGMTDPEVRIARYKQAGLADDLAETFTPVWADIFGENKTAEITTTVDNNLEVNEVRGEEGSYVWRVAATVTFQGTWHANGATQVQSPRTATWWLTIDQDTETITAIDQPTPEELQISVNEEE